MAITLKTIYFIANICLNSNPLECKEFVAKKEETTLGECYKAMPDLLKELEQKNDGWNLESFMCSTKYKTNV